MDTDLENIVETSATQLLHHLAVCIAMGRQLTQGETMDLLRHHIRNAVMQAEHALLARQAPSTTEKETKP